MLAEGLAPVYYEGCYVVTPRIVRVYTHAYAPSKGKARAGAPDSYRWGKVTGLLSLFLEAFFYTIVLCLALISIILSLVLREAAQI